MMSACDPGQVILGGSWTRKTLNVLLKKYITSVLMNTMEWDQGPFGL